MTTTIFDLITDWKQLPVAYVKIIVNGNTYYFYKNMDETQVAIAPLLEDNDTGGQTICGYGIKINLTPVQNKMETFLPFISDINSYKPTEVDIYCYEGSSGPTIAIQSDASSVTVKDWHASWESIAGTDIIFKIILQGIFSKNLVAATSPKLFTQTNM